MALQRGTGWVQTEASRQWLRLNQKHFDLAAFRSAPIPAVIDPRADLAVKDQGQLGACSGFSRSLLEQRLQDICSGKARHMVFSAMFAYLMNQKCCGCFGADNGATIAGSVQAAGSTGICMDDLFPYTKSLYNGQYSDVIPDAATTQGKLHLIKSHSVLTSYLAAQQYLGTSGVIQIGIPVGNAFQNYAGGLLTKAMVQADANNPEGGHALAVVGYVDQPGADGRKPLIGINSWGPDWGIKGSFLIDPAAWDFWCSRLHAGDTELTGISNLESFDAAPIDWSQLYASAA